MQNFTSTAQPIKQQPAKPLVALQHLPVAAPATEGTHSRNNPKGMVSGEMPKLSDHLQQKKPVQKVGEMKMSEAVGASTATGLSAVLIGWLKEQPGYDPAKAQEALQRQKQVQRERAEKQRQEDTPDSGSRGPGPSASS